jgi:GntR family transcriptional regulator
MSTINRNGTPAYQRIQKAIRTQIESGHLRPGDSVPSERELAKIHTVSLMTARHALVGLEREGLVDRRRGAGTFVASPKIQFNKLMSYTEHMSSRGLTARSRVLVSRIIAGEAEVAARLGLPPNISLVKIERLRLTGAEPFALETCHVPAGDFSEILHAPLGRASLFGTLEHEYGVELAYADEEVDATAAEGRVAELLEVKQGDPVLRIRQVIYSTKAKPVLYVVGLYRSEHHRLLVRRFR